MKHFLYFIVGFIAIYIALQINLSFTGKPWIILVLSMLTTILSLVALNQFKAKRYTVNKWKLMRAACTFLIINYLLTSTMSITQLQLAAWAILSTATLEMSLSKIRWKNVYVSLLLKILFVYLFLRLGIALVGALNAFDLSPEGNMLATELGNLRDKLPLALVMWFSVTEPSFLFKIQNHNNTKLIIIGFLYGLLTILLIGCSSAATEQNKFSAMQKKIDLMPMEDLKLLIHQGHLSALEEYAMRHCGNKLNTICEDTMLQAANRGHPPAMRMLALLMSGENIPIYNLYQSYVWQYIESHFNRDTYDFNSPMISGFQELEISGDYALMNYIEDELPPEEIERAKAEAEVKMVELWEKLQAYCEEWKDTDYVCFYKLGEQPSYEKYKDN